MEQSHFLGRWIGGSTMENRRREHKKKFERPVGTKRPEKTFLILCEGTKTEPNYFRSFHVISAQVEIVGTAMNTMSLVNHAREVVKDRPDEYDEIWLVFDKDSFDRDIFNEAVFFCETHYRQGFRAAYSNEAFEIWYLLHFELIKKSISRFHYPDMLSKRLGFFYKKNHPHMYNVLLSRQPAAIQNAKKLYSQRSPSPARDNPSTTVFMLVEELNKHLRK